MKPQNDALTGYLWGWMVGLVGSAAVLGLTYLALWWLRQLG